MLITLVTILGATAVVAVAFDCEVAAAILFAATLTLMTFLA